MTVNLVSPGTIYGERTNQLDLRFAKPLRIGPSRTTVNLDLYNLLNANAVLLQNNTYGPKWQQPTSVLPGRLFKFSAQLDF